MPRNDRWRPKQVARMVTPEARAEAQRREQELSERRMTIGATSTTATRAPVSPILCQHGVSWLLCTTCSKPVRR